MEAYEQFVCAGSEIIGYVEMEAVITIRPTSHFLAVDIYYRIAHRAIKEQGIMLARGGRDIDGGFIPSITHPRQTT